MSKIPADQLNITLTGRVYRKHNTRLISRLRKKFPRSEGYRVEFFDGKYEVYTREQYTSRQPPYKQLTREEAVALLEAPAAAS